MLEEIIAYKRQEVAERQRIVSTDQQMRRAADIESPRTPSFGGPMSLIGEVKRRSPSAGAIAADIDPASHACGYERGGAAVISVLTDSRYFGGCFEDLAAVHDAVRIPVLCKDFIITPYQIYEARGWGADIVLLIVAAMRDGPLIELHRLADELGMASLVEVHDQHDLARALAMDARLIGINNRDLTDFSVDLLTTEYLAPLIPDDVMVVSESGITSRSDVERVGRAGARAVLVGETLMRSTHPEQTIAELLG